LAASIRRSARRLKAIAALRAVTMPSKMPASSRKRQGDRQSRCGANAKPGRHPINGQAGLPANEFPFDGGIGQLRMEENRPLEYGVEGKRLMKGQVGPKKDLATNDAKAKAEKK
jgi:hypothetical protein